MSETHTDASGTRTSGQDQAIRLARLRGASFGVVVMLIVQFILGILLFLAAVAQLVRAIGTRHKLSMWLSALGLLSILGAGFAGLGFTGSGAAGASLGMSLAFAVALACYAILVFALPSSASRASTTSTTLCSSPRSPRLGPRGIVGT